MFPFLRACLVLSLISCTVFTAFAQPGTLSSSFGINGLLTDPSRQTFEKAITSQPDKKILIGSQGFYQGYETFLVDRLLADGTKDGSFGTGGTVYISFQGADNMSLNSTINAIALLPNGRIITAGHAMGNGKNIAIARLLPDGSPDASFGKNGTSLTGFNFDETITAIAIQADGKIIAGGQTQVSPSPSDYRFFVARYSANGAVDSSFGTNGRVVSTSAGVVNAVVVQPDTRILAAGYSSDISGTFFHIERYNTDGSYDKSFGSGGSVSNQAEGAFLNFLNDIALQADGKIVAAGRTNLQVFTLVRYNSTGMPDDGFGKNGVVTMLLPGATGEARKVVLTAKGDHILATGTRSDNSNSDFVVASWSVAGTPDTAFGNNGVVTTDFGGTDINNSATLCADGSLVALGSNAGRYPFPVRALAKYNGYPATVSLFVKVKRWLQNHTLTWNGLPAEDNIASYKIEQSRHGRTGFTEIAAVSGSSAAKEYSLTNNHLLEGTNYYRIKAIGKDGSVRYSETVRADNGVAAISVYPNPAKDVIVVSGLKAGAASHISITSNSGKVMMKAVSNGSVQYRLSISSLQPGTYYVVVTAPDGSVEREMFVKE